MKLAITLLSISLLASSSCSTSGEELEKPPYRRLMPSGRGGALTGWAAQRLPEALRRCPGRGCAGGCCPEPGFGVCCADRLHCAEREADCPVKEAESAMGEKVARAR